MGSIFICDSAAEAGGSARRTVYIDPILPALFALAAAALIMGQIFRWLRQPAVAGYIIAGIALGPSGYHLFDASENIVHVGNLGVVLLLFYVGMEISVPKLLEGWKISVVGTILQVILTTTAVAGISTWFGWSPAKIVLFGFITALSSTAVVLKMLRDWGELDSPVGRHVTGILLIQDLLLVPMLIIVGILADDQTMSPSRTGIQIGGGLALLALLGWAAKRGSIRMPFADHLRASHETQLFATLTFCFGFALLTGLLGLTTALGAFFAGILISLSRETDWVRQSIEPFHLFFVSVFFVSIGLLVDLAYISENLLNISLLVFLVLVFNTAVNAGLLRVLGEPWRTALYAGSLLSQIGEFSFVLAAIGLRAGIIDDAGGYQTTISVISLSLLLSPLWISIVKGLTHPGSKQAAPPATGA